MVVSVVVSMVVSVAVSDVSAAGIVGRLVSAFASVNWLQEHKSAVAVDKAKTAEMVLCFLYFIFCS
jgi:hypothetical protein